MMLSLIVVMLALLSFAISKKFIKIYNTPLSMMSVMWMVSICMYEASSIPYPKLDIDTVMIIALYWFAAILGTCLGSVIPKRILFVKADSLVSQKRIMLLYIITFISAIMYFYIVVKQVGLNRLIFEQTSIRKIYFGEGIQVGKYLGSYSVGFLYSASIVAGLDSVRNKNKMNWIVPFISSVLIDAAYVGRIYTITTAFLFFISRMIENKNVQKKARVPYAVVILISLLVLMLITSVTASRYVERSSGIIGIYVYFTSSWQVLNDIVINDRCDWFYGSQSFYPIVLMFSKIGLFSLKDWYSIVDDYSMTPYEIASNMPGSIGFIYSDFGVFGVVVFPAIVYAMAGYYQKNYNTNKGQYYKLGLIICYYISFISLVSLPFSFSFITLLLGLMYVFINKRLVFQKR